MISGPSENKDIFMIKDKKRPGIVEGYQAYFAGLSKSDNPYGMGTEEAALWQRGFKAGEKEDVDHDPDGN
jgi:ribosome modulation factor